MKRQNHFLTDYTTLVAGMMILASLLLFSCKKDNKDTTPQTVQFSGTLSGQAEVPPVNSPGTGTVTATFDPATKTLQYKFKWSNLSGPAKGMHFHDGAPGVSGGIVIPVSGFPNEPSGEVSGTSSPLNDTLITDLMEGNLYGNIHTDDHKGGEVRAQMVKQ